MSGNEEAVVTEENDRERRRRQRIAKLRETFTPASPVQTREIFSGRQKQLLDCLHVMNQVGTHGILHGERGVGKTSIANIVKIVAGNLDIHFDVAEEVKQTVAIKIECTSKDSFRGIVEQIY